MDTIEDIFHYTSHKKMLNAIVTYPTKKDDGPEPKFTKQHKYFNTKQCDFPIT
jgi:hypothetical protein